VFLLTGGKSQPKLRQPSFFADPNMKVPDFNDPESLLDHCRTALSPEQDLLSTLIKSACSDIKNAHGPTLGAALWWVFYERDPRRPASFVWCCTELGCDPAYLRIGIRRWWRVHKGGEIPCRQLCETAANIQRGQLKPMQGRPHRLADNGDEGRHEPSVDAWLRRGAREWMSRSNGREGG